MQNFSYIIGDEKTREAAIVDCGWNADDLIKAAEYENLQIKKIILTHSHFDHIKKLDELASKTNSGVYFHENDEDTIKKEIRNEKIKIHMLKDNDEIGVGKIKIKIIHTPGHTQGSICLLFENKLITGDTLFVNAIGRTDLPGGNASQLFESLQKLKRLDDSIEIYPGHDYGPTKSDTLGNQKKTNPYLMYNSKAQFLNLIE